VGSRRAGGFGVRWGYVDAAGATDEEPDGQASGFLLPTSPPPAARAAGLVECSCSSDLRGGNEFGIGLHTVLAKVQTIQLFILSNP